VPDGLDHALASKAAKQLLVAGKLSVSEIAPSNRGEFGATAANDSNFLPRKRPRIAA
jgi:hypothetical protein